MKKSVKTARSKELADLHLKVRYQNVEALRLYAGNARTHSHKQITHIAASIRKFGLNNPVLVDADNSIIAGHGRVEAAQRNRPSPSPTTKTTSGYPPSLSCPAAAREKRCPSSMTLGT